MVVIGGVFEILNKANSIKELKSALLRKIILTISHLVLVLWFLGLFLYWFFAFVLVFAKYFLDRAKGVVYYRDGELTLNKTTWRQESELRFKPPNIEGK